MNESVPAIACRVQMNLRTGQINGVLLPQNGAVCSDCHSRQRRHRAQDI